METVLKVNKETSLFGTFRSVTKVEVKEGILQIWNGEFCLATYALEEFSNGLSLEVGEEEE